MTPVRWVAAHSAAEAAALLHAHAPQARPLAFGADVLALWKDGVRDRAVDAELWVDLTRAPELAQIERGPDGGWRLGAMATLQRLQHTPGIAPLLAEAIARIASPQLRARSTLGGNLLQRPRCWSFRHPDIVCFKKGGHGCPAIGGPAQAHPGAIDGGPCHAAHPSDLATALLALDARVEIVGADGARELPMIELYRGAAADPTREAQIAPDEVLAAVHVPPQPAAQAFEKRAPRSANEFAWGAAAVVLHVGHQSIERVRVALGGVASEPMLVGDASALLCGRAPAAVDVESVARQLTAFRHDLGVATHARAALCREALRCALERALAAAMAEVGVR